VATVSEANAEFWNELCGTWLARSLGIVEPTPEALASFDAAYFSYYPYLLRFVNRAGVSDRTVLEIGLGYGSLGGYLAPRARAYFAVDIAQGPVGLMQQRLSLLGLPPDRAQRRSALELPFPMDTFDTVISIGTLHHTGDLTTAVSEVQRVLRPGGTALVMVYNAHSFRRMAAWPRLRVSAAVGRLREPADRQLRRMYDQRMDGTAAPHTDFVSAGEARRLFREFRDVRVERRNFDDYTIWRFRLHRERFLGSLDRLLGLDLYITATR
jgi:SAM-dependent methyltransferase